MNRLHVFAWAAWLFVFGCAGTSTSTALTPVTGILVRADALVSGIGCGTRADQIYRYAAIVTQDITQGEQLQEIAIPNVGGVFECYADAAFRQLVPGPAGSLSFNVEIYAFNQAAYAAQDKDGAIERAAATDWGQLQGFRPTYKTKCTATQQQDVEVLAVCAPPTGGPSTIRIDTAHFPTQLGVDANCGTAYVSVQGTYRVGETTGTLARVSCPAPILVSPARAPANYTIDLELLDTAGARAGVVRCHASTIPGTEAAASCDPI